MARISLPSRRERHYYTTRRITDALITALSVACADDYAEPLKVQYAYLGDDDGCEVTPRRSRHPSRKRVVGYPLAAGA